jgi:hypothetical protein
MLSLIVTDSYEVACRLGHSVQSGCNPHNGVKLLQANNTVDQTLWTDRNEDDRKTG